MLLVGFLVALIQGYVVEGLRIVATQDPWGIWSPVGLCPGQLLVALGVQGCRCSWPSTASCWWTHLVTAFAGNVYLPYSKAMHLLVAPLSLFFRELEPAGRLRPMEIEGAERLGVKALSDFTWKDLLDLDACTECGRCPRGLPRPRGGQAPQPQDLLLDLQRQMAGLAREEVTPAVRPALAPGVQVAAATLAEDAALEIVGHSIDPEVIWSCTTCNACVEVCPVEIEHVAKIIDLRRYQVMEEAAIDETPQQALQGLEDRAHPFRGTQASRTDWYQDLPYVKTLAETGPVDYLYWVGCAVALNERTQRTARALARILHAAGIDFAVLGEEEVCTGDPAGGWGTSTSSSSWPGRTSTPSSAPR